MKEDFTALFNKFVGAEMKIPGRMTCDTCPVEEELQTIAMTNGVMLAFKFTDGSSADVPEFTAPNRVEILVEPPVGGKCRIVGLKG